MESSLVGLRAELQKKKAEAAAGQRIPAGKKERERERERGSCSSNPGVRERAAKDEEAHQAELRRETDARKILEKKAAMYDSINRGVEVLENDNLNHRFLINFQKKIVDDVMEKKKTREGREKLRKERQEEREETRPEEYDARNSDEEWVEYTDAFGRTRECLRAELPHMLEKEKRLSNDLNSVNDTEDKTGSEPPHPPHHLQDLHREALHRKWEAEERVNATKNDIHYQDVLYDEARTHGTGYLKFSRDATERKAQMDLLRELQKEGVRGKANTAAAATRREKAMKARLEKVRQRKRLKMGLPMKDETTLKTPPGSDGEEEEEVEQQEEAPPSPPPQRKKVGGVREWDIGKEGVTSTLTQEEWVLRQRSERDHQFAPPSTYHHQDAHTQRRDHNVPSSDDRQTTENMNTLRTQKFESWREERPARFAPPTAYNKNQDSGASSSKPRVEQESYAEERPAHFAPPATYEYYGPTTTQRRHKYKNSYSDLSAAIDKGLSHLRKLSD